jgi:hypothetical protein
MNTISPPDDEHRVVRNMYRIIIINVLHNVTVNQAGQFIQRDGGMFTARTKPLFLPFN